MIRAPRSHAIIFTALFSTIFLVIFNYTLTLMAGVYIVGELGGSNYITTYTVTFYALGNALGVPLGAFLWRQFGVTRLLVFFLLMFAFFNVLCGLATTFSFLIACRFLQGLMGGPFYGLVNRLQVALVPPAKRSLFTSLNLTILAVTPVIGASYGGWIGYDYHWRWVFFINIPFILGLAVFYATQIKGLNQKEKNTFDLVGYLAYFFTILFLGFFIATGQELDWLNSRLLITCLLVGIPSLIFFILWSLRHPTPIIDFEVLKKPVVIFALTNLTILFSAYFGMVILLALWLKLYVQYTPLWIATLLGTMAIAGLLPSVLVGDKWGRTDARFPLLLSIGCLAISCFNTATFTEDVNFGRVVGSRILAGFGLAFFLPPIFRLSFRSVPDEKSLSVVVIFQVVRALASGIGASFYTILWQRREIFYHERFTSLLTPFSQLTKNFFQHAKQFHLHGEAAKAQLDYFVERQSIALALDDCFYLMGWILMGLLVLVACTLPLKEHPFLPERRDPRFKLPAPHA